MKENLLNRVIIGLLLLSGIFGMGNVMGQTLMGSFTFEGNNTTGLTGNGGGTGPIGVNATLSDVRTGSYSLKFGSPLSSNATRFFNTANQSESNGETWFVIGWAKAGASSTAIGVQGVINTSAPSSYVMPSTSDWTRFSNSRTFTGASSSPVRWYGKFVTTAATEIIYYDDLIFYKSTTSTIVDLIAPTAATGVTGTCSSGLSWTNGTDTDPGATGIQNTLIFKRTSGTNGSNDLILNDQGQYSLTPTIGPSVVGNWTLVDASVPSAATTYTTGTFAEGEEYAIVHSDLAFNYSSPSYVVVSCGPNLSPVITDQSFSVNENSTNGTAVGTVVASDPNAGQILTYSITAGNTGNVFSINSSTGAITVAGALDFETMPSYSLSVEVTDNGSPVINASATITIDINDETNEFTPSINNQGFSIDENSAVSTTVGTVVASDADAGQTLAYIITAGNTGSVFSINSSTGEITVNGSLNFETITSYPLTIQVSDNGSPVKNASATVTITINDIDENPSTPSIGNQGFSIDENSAVSTAVGMVVTSDADAGQTLMFSITAGNTGNGFSINSSTGEISVAGVLDFEATSSYLLTVEVSDNGEPVKSASATVTITINDLVETGIADADFSSYIKIYPNPSKKDLYIESNGKDLSGAKVKILNAQGIVVLESDFINALNIETLNKGIYTFIITQEEKTAVKKLVIE